MTFQVQRIGDAYGVLFTAEQMHSVGLSEGSEVDVQPRMQPHDASPEYVSLKEGLRAYKQTEPRWAAVYEELAK